MGTLVVLVRFVTRVGIVEVHGRLARLMSAALVVMIMTGPMPVPMGMRVTVGMLTTGCMPVIPVIMTITKIPPNAVGTAVMRNLTILWIAIILMIVPMSMAVASDRGGCPPLLNSHALTIFTANPKQAIGMASVK